MPFKSKAQRRKFYAMADKGEISKDTVKRWEKHTKDKDLPERKEKKKKAMLTSGQAEKVAAFKAGFWLKMAEKKCLPTQLTRAFAKQALIDPLVSGGVNLAGDVTGKGVDLAGSGIRTLGQYALLAPLFGGAATGIGSAMLDSPGEADVEALKKLETLETLKELTKQIRARSGMVE